MSNSLCVTVVPAFSEALEFRSTGLHEEYLETINGYTGELIVERVEYGPRGTDEWARLGTAVVAAWDTTSWRSVTRLNPVAQPSELPATQEAQ